MKSLSPFKKIFNVFTSCLLLITTLFISEMLKDNFILPYFSALGLACYSFLFIYACAGIYGTLIELASGESYTLPYQHVFTNANQYFHILFLLWILPYVSNFFISWIVLTDDFFPPRAVFTHAKPLIYYIFAYYVIRHKYLLPLKIQPISPPSTSFSWILALSLTLLVDTSLYYWPLLFPATTIKIAGAISFLQLSANYFLFILITNLILRKYPQIYQHYDHKNEIYLINPMNGGGLTSLAYRLTPYYPPFFVVLKALTPAHYKLKIFNRVIWKPHYIRPHKLVAITCFTSNCQEAYKIAKMFKKAGSKVIMGGPHVTYLPDEALKFCDSVVIGEAEGVWEDIIKDYETDCLKKEYKGIATERQYDAVHQELLNSKPFIIKDFLETTRGCKFKCHFCTIPGLNDGRLYHKPIKQIVALLKKIKSKYAFIQFIDNNIYSDPAYAKELFKSLKPLKIKWHTQCTIDMAKNTETLKLAKESGCAGLLLGYEINTKSKEKLQGGKFLMAENYLRYTRILQKEKIRIKAHLIFGFDSDSLYSYWDIWKFCWMLKPHIAALSLLTPLPGSQHYYEILRHNRITNLNWKHYTCQNLVIQHPRMNNASIQLTFQPFKIFLFLTTSSLGHLLIISSIILFFIEFLISS